MRFLRAFVLAMVLSLVMPVGAMSGVEGMPTRPYRGSAPAPEVGDVGEHDRNLALASRPGRRAAAPAESQNDPVVVDGSLFTVPGWSVLEQPEPEVGAGPKQPEGGVVEPVEVVGFVEDESVEVVERRDANRRVYANPDGTLTAQLSSVPINFEDKNGGWEPIDNRLYAQPDGTVANGANDWGIRFGSLKSGIWVDTGDRELSWMAPDAADVMPEIEPDGVSVRYRDVWDGVDVVYRMRGNGVEEFIEIRHARARAEFLFEFAGVEFDEADGGLVVKGEGRRVSVSPVESYDRTGRRVDLAARTGLVKAESVRADQASQRGRAAAWPKDRSGRPVDVVTPVRVVLDQKWLRSQPDEVFPIVVDPGVLVGRWSTTAYKQSGAVNSDGWIRIGNPGETSTSTYYWRSVSHFNFASLWSGVPASTAVRVIESKLLTTTSSSDVAGTHALNMYWAGEWGYHATVAPIHGWGAVRLVSTVQCCSKYKEHVDARLNALIDSWALSRHNGALLFTGEERTGYTYKRFDADMWVTYNLAISTVPVSPANGAVVDKVAPTLTAAAVSDPEGLPLTYRFEVVNEASQLVASGSSATNSWQVTDLKLDWNKAYAWRVATWDGYHQSAWSAYSWFMPLIVVPDAEAKGAGFNPFTERIAGVDVFSGTFSWSVTDVAVATPTQDLALSRTYNSSSISNGAFGRGWVFPFDMRASNSTAVGKQGVTVTLPDGRKQFYGKNSNGSYAAAYGYGSKLVWDTTAGVRRLTDASQNVFDFDSNGNLSSITDSNGRKITSSWSGSIQTLTDVASGRKLLLTWSGGTPNRVVSVRTEAVVGAGTELVWNYAYSGDLLSKVCDARNPNTTNGSCTTYEYSSNRLVRVKPPKGNKLFELTYDANGKVTSSSNGTGDKHEFSYATTKQNIDTGAGTVSLWRTTVKAPNHQVDPTAKHVTYFDHDDLGRLVHMWNDGMRERKSYDDNGFLSGHRDLSGRTTLFTYDSSGNLTKRIDTGGSEWLFTYNDKNSLTSETNPLGQTINYVNNTKGNRTKQTTPMLMVTEWPVTPGGTNDGYGTVPAGLLDRLIEPGGRVTERFYDSQGDLRKVLYPSGLVEEFDHDNLGRVIWQKTTIAEGVWWLESYQYDALGRLVLVTESAVENPISGVTHQKQTEHVYDPNGNLVSNTVRDLLGGDSDRVTSFEYDNADREKKVTNLVGGSTTTSMTREFDRNGNVTAVTDGLGRRTETQYSGRNLPIKRILKGFYSPSDGLAARDIVLGEWTYYMIGLLKTSKVYRGAEVIESTYHYKWDQLYKTVVTGAGPGGADLVTSEIEFDAAGRVKKEFSGDGTLVVTHTRDDDGRLTQSVVANAKSVDGKALSVDKTIKYFYDTYGFVNKKQVIGGGRTEEVRYVNDVMGNVKEETVENGVTDLTVEHLRDARGLETETIDPAGKKTNRTYDILGRLVKVESPQVSTVSYDVGGGVLSRVPGSERPSQVLGYNTFGDLTHSEDGAGNVTITNYDRLGRRTLITHPSYTSPVTGLTVSPTESYVYDLVGNLTGVTDRRGNVTSFEFDSLNRGVRRTDPQVGGQPVVSSSVFDELGNLVKSTDPEGAVVRFGYDKLGRMTSQTQVVGGVDLVSTVKYDKLGNQIESNPAGYGDTDKTTRVFSPAGELLKVTSPFTDADTTNQWFVYDAAGRNTKTVFHDGTYSLVTYDLAGRETRRGHHGSGGTELAWTTTTYNSAGRVASTATRGGAETSYGYSDVGWVTSITEKVSGSVSVTTGYGYDLLGNHTETVDGEGRVWAQTYNPWGLLERRVEPATPQHPGLDQRMFTTGYDPAGLAVREVFPTGPEVVGGPDVTVEVSRTFDVLGRPVSESSGGVVSSMTYDRVGRLMSVSHPSGTVSNTYDERGLLLSSSGPSGNTTYVYDEAGRLVSRVDPAGSAQFSWWPSGGLRTMSDGVSAVVRNYQWTRLGRLQSVVFGSGAHRDYVWSETGRLVSDSMVDKNGFESYRVSYTYTPDGYVETEVVGPLGVAGSGTHTYTYDLAGRVTSWTSPLGGLVGYTWDAAGNRLTAGSEAFSYDARNRLVTSGTDTNVWSARGTLLQATEGGVAKAFSFDGLGRMTAAGDVEYSYDGLGRMATRGTVGLLYSGLGIQPVDDGETTTVVSPSGAPATISDGTTVGVVVRDRHGDVVAMTDGDGILVGSRSYDPFGGLVATVGVVGTNLGFQSSWTDPDTDLVNMGARWYQPAWATFVSRDPYSGMLRTPISLNRYTYAHANPLAYWDPLGYAAQYIPDYVKKQLAQQQPQKTTPKEKSSRVAGMSNALYTHAASNGGNVTVAVTPISGVPAGLQQQIAQATPNPFVPSFESSTTNVSATQQFNVDRSKDFVDNPAAVLFGRPCTAGAIAQGGWDWDSFSKCSDNPFKDPLSAGAARLALAKPDGQHFQLSLHGELEFLGLFSFLGIGILADVVNAGLYATEGDWGNSLWSLAGAAPGLGDGLTLLRIGGKNADKAVDAARNIAKNGDEIVDAGRDLDRFGRSLSDLPKDTRILSDEKSVFSKLSDDHGIPDWLSGNRLHEIKAAAGLGPADNVVFDYAGGVWDPVSGSWLGSLTAGGKP